MINLINCDRTDKFDESFKRHSCCEIVTIIDGQILQKTNIPTDFQCVNHSYQIMQKPHIFQIIIHKNKCYLCDQLTNICSSWQLHSKYNILMNTTTRVWLSIFLILPLRTSQPGRDNNNKCCKYNGHELRFFHI